MFVKEHFSLKEEKKTPLLLLKEMLNTEKLSKNIFPCEYDARLSTVWSVAK